MSFVIGRGHEHAEDRPTGRLGTYRALDGSSGAPLYLDFDAPHGVLVVGKRGYGKSYTLGVIVEELARTDAIAPVVADPMGAFERFGEASDLPTAVVTQPKVAPDALTPRSWCALVGLSPEGGAGALVWQAAQHGSTLEEMREQVRAAEADESDTRAARNHIDMADGWGVFDAAGLDAAALSGPEATVLDLSGLEDSPMNAVVRGVVESLYQARVSEEVPRLPWLLVDEAHTFFRGVARPALETVLTRGRAPGVSTVFATQRPSAVPEVGISQSDVLVSHRLTARADVEALQTAQPTYMNESLEKKMPTATGEVVIVDDATETVHAAQIRERETVHDGDSPTARDVCPAEDYSADRDDTAPDCSETERSVNR